MLLQEYSLVTICSNNVHTLREYMNCEQEIFEEGLSNLSLMWIENRRFCSTRILKETIVVILTKKNSSILITLMTYYIVYLINHIKADHSGKKKYIPKRTRIPVCPRVPA